VVTKSQPILAHGQQILRRTMLERFGAGEASRPGADCFHPRNFPMRGRTRDSDSRQRAAPFRCETGEIVGGVSILQNVYRKKRAEQRLPKAKRDCRPPSIKRCWNKGAGPAIITTSSRR
jgi:hypothetical protein